METGEDTLAELAGVISRALGEENDYLTKFLIGTFGDEEGGREIGTELALELFGLDFETSGTDDVIATTKNTEALRVETGEFGDVVGDEGFGTDFRSIDDKGAFVRETETDRGEGRIPIGSFGSGKTTEGDVGESLSHTVGAPDGVGEGLEFCG
jgi:hypothetical protein